MTTIDQIIPRLEKRPYWRILKNGKNFGRTSTPDATPETVDFSELEETVSLLEPGKYILQAGATKTDAAPVNYTFYVPSDGATEPAQISGTGGANMPFNQTLFQMFMTQNEQINKLNAELAAERSKEQLRRLQSEIAEIRRESEEEGSTALAIAGLMETDAVKSLIQIGTAALAKYAGIDAPILPPVSGPEPQPQPEPDPVRAQITGLSGNIENKIGAEKTALLLNIFASQNAEYLNELIKKSYGTSTDTAAANDAAATE